MKSSICFVLSAAVFAFGYVAVVHADNVYKWTDSEGRVHYSSNAPTKDAKPAKLPDIMRGEVKLVEQKLVSCDKHGGVNCQAGSDSDGSVICFDGFKGASARFRFTCNAPKLEITDISDVSAEGSFTVFVRNSKSVDAQKPILTVKPKEGADVRLKGPDTIQAFGVAEFQYLPGASDKRLDKPTFGDVTITCANCPS